MIEVYKLRDEKEMKKFIMKNRRTIISAVELDFYQDEQVELLRRFIRNKEHGIDGILDIKRTYGIEIDIRNISKDNLDKTGYILLSRIRKLSLCDKMIMLLEMVYRLKESLTVIGALEVLNENAREIILEKSVIVDEICCNTDDFGYTGCKILMMQTGDIEPIMLLGGENVQIHRRRNKGDLEDIMKWVIDDKVNESIKESLNGNIGITVVNNIKPLSTLENIEINKEIDLSDTEYEELLNSNELLCRNAELTLKLFKMKADVFVFNNLEAIFSTRQLNKVLQVIAKVSKFNCEIHIGDNSDLVSKIAGTGGGLNGKDCKQVYDDRVQ